VRLKKDKEVVSRGDLFILMDELSRGIQAVFILTVIRHSSQPWYATRVLRRRGAPQVRRPSYSAGPESMRILLDKKQI